MTVNLEDMLIRIEKVCRQLMEEVSQAKLLCPSLTESESTNGFNWKSLDWTKSDHDLAASTGYASVSIKKYRALYGEPFNKSKSARNISSRDGRVKVSDEQIEKADWENLRDLDLAREWNISRERVRQLRVKYKKTECLFRRFSSKYIEAKKWIESHRAELEGKHIHDVSRLVPFDIPLQSIRRFFRDLQIDCKYEKKWVNGKQDFSKLMDWNLPNECLSRIWNIRNSRIANYRCMFRHPKAKWSGAGFASKYLNDAEFHSAIARQLPIAKEHGSVTTMEDMEKWIEERRKAVNARIESRRITTL